ncbi:DUF551 domain-containing protein [Enterobacter hormaechei]|uniref:DUF551 domain-containing protein n=1 Tax=Enterobacter hormaechei TaxID=158836 RepID=UPI003F55DC3D
MSNIDKHALIAKIKKQTESFDTVVLKEDEANALLDELDELEALKLALASLEAEPDYMRYDCGCCGWETIEDWRENDVCPKCNHHPMGKTPLYAAPPAPVSMKDHQIRELVNELRDIAVEYHGTQQLRERIARTVRAAMLQGAAGNSPVIPDGWVACSERMPDADGNYWGWWSESKRQGPVWFIKSELQAQFQSSEITHWMPLPAAPQQEVKSGR